jgi:ligand-binding sensor domain-containing protein
LASWKDGKLTQYAELTGQYIFKLLEDREGTVWASGANVPIGKLCSIQNSHVKCYGEDGSLGIGVVGLFEDSQGSLWVGVPSGLWRWKPGQPKFYPLPEPNGIRGLGEDEVVLYWLVTRAGSNDSAMERLRLIHYQAFQAISL